MNEPETPPLNTPVPATLENQSAKIYKNKKLLGIVLLVILALVLGGVYIWYQRQNQKPSASARPWNDNPKFAPTEVVAKVGNETIYGDDLNYELSGAYSAYKKNQTVSDDKLKEMLIKEVATKSAIIQAGVAENIISVSQSSPHDLVERDKLIESLRKVIQSQSTKMDLSAISIWYYNMYPPKIPEAQAKQLALSKINRLHDQLVSKKITMEQAAEAIKNDSELAKLDRNYVGNAFVSMTDKYPTDVLFNFTKLQEVAASLKDGEISPVVNVEDILMLDSKPLPEQFFAIVKANKVVQGKYISYQDWIKKAVQRYGNIQ